MANILQQEAMPNEKAPDPGMKQKFPKQGGLSKGLTNKDNWDPNQTFLGKLTKSERNGDM